MDVEKHKKELVPAPDPVPDQALALACLGLLLSRQGYQAAADPYSPWNRLDAWRLNDQGYDEQYFIDQDGSEIEVTVHYPEDGGYRLQLPGGEMLADGEIDEGGTLWADLDGLKISAAIVRDSDTVTILSCGKAYRIEYVDRMALVDVDLEEGSKVTAPLPGKIVQVLVEPGSNVKKGDTLLILEAMKMEHAITASRDAVIADIPFATGEQVTEGTELVTFEPEGD